MKRELNSAGRLQLQYHYVLFGKAGIVYPQIRLTDIVYGR